MCRQLAEVRAQHADLERRLCAWEQRRPVSQRDAQRLVRYVGLVSGVHGRLQAVVGQLQAAFPRVLRSLGAARGALPGGDAAQQPPAYLAGARPQERPQQPAQRLPTPGEALAPEVVAGVASAHELVLQVQLAVDALAEQLGDALPLGAQLQA